MLICVECRKEPVVIGRSRSRGAACLHRWVQRADRPRAERQAAFGEAVEGTFSIAEAVRLAAVTDSAIRRRVQIGTLPSVRIVVHGISNGQPRTVVRIPQSCRRALVAEGLERRLAARGLTVAEVADRLGYTWRSVYAVLKRAQVRPIRGCISWGDFLRVQLGLRAEGRIA